MFIFKNNVNSNFLGKRAITSSLPINVGNIVVKRMYLVRGKSLMVPSIRAYLKNIKW